ncbi:MAG TPA: response regulator [Polyangiaceae bacterium]|nr:response regulator [Polyangiaceae bacterium]
MANSRILVVDDSETLRRQVRGALEAAGLAVAEAAEGVEALWRVRSEAPFDLILCDIYMPAMGGLDFVREVRKLPAYVSTPIIVLTSDASRERRAEGKAAGATAWLLKPPHMPALIISIQAALFRVSVAPPPDSDER